MPLAGLSRLERIWNLISLAFIVLGEMCVFPVLQYWSTVYLKVVPGGWVGVLQCLWNVFGYPWYLHIYFCNLQFIPIHTPLVIGCHARHSLGAIGVRLSSLRRKFSFSGHFESNRAHKC